MWLFPYWICLVLYHQVVYNVNIINNRFLFVLFPSCYYSCQCYKNNRPIKIVWWRWTAPQEYDHIFLSANQGWYWLVLCTDKAEIHRQAMEIVKHYTIYATLKSSANLRNWQKILWLLFLQSQRMFSSSRKTLGLCSVRMHEWKICGTRIHHSHTYLSIETTRRTVAITSLLPICIHRDTKTYDPIKPHDPTPPPSR